MAFNTNKQTRTESELEFRWLTVRKFGDETDRPNVEILGGSLAEIRVSKIQM